MKHSYAKELSAKQRAALKGMAHSLKPVVQVGNAGLSPEVLKEINLALNAHELIKIQLPGNNSSDEKESDTAELMGELPPHAHIVSRLGRAVILYLEKEPNESKIQLKNLR